MVDVGQEQKSQKKYIVGSAELNFKRDHMEIHSLFSEAGTSKCDLHIYSSGDNLSLVNFDFLEDILNKSVIDNLMINPKDTPLLFTETALHNKEARIKLTEFMFEKYQCPAIFIGKAPVLSSFSCGRSTAIIVDSGFKTTYATPVHDGYALQKCIIKHDIGGHSITQDLLSWLGHDRRLEILPRFAYKKKFVNVNGVENFETSKVDTSNVHPSYYHWA
jgi:actin-like protein 6A